MIRVTKVWGLDFSWTPALALSPLSYYFFRPRNQLFFGHPCPNYLFKASAPILVMDMILAE